MGTSTCCAPKRPSGRSCPRSGWCRPKSCRATGATCRVIAFTWTASSRPRGERTLRAVLRTIGLTSGTCRTPWRTRCFPVTEEGACDARPEIQNLAGSTAGDSSALPPGAKDPPPDTIDELMTTVMARQLHGDVWVRSVTALRAAAHLAKRIPAPDLAVLGTTPESGMEVEPIPTLTLGQLLTDAQQGIPLTMEDIFDAIFLVTAIGPRDHPRLLWWARGAFPKTPAICRTDFLRRHQRRHQPHPALSGGAGGLQKWRRVPPKPHAGAWPAELPHRLAHQPGAF